MPSWAIIIIEIWLCGHLRWNFDLPKKKNFYILADFFWLALENTQLLGRERERQVGKRFEKIFPLLCCCFFVFCFFFRNREDRLLIVHGLIDENVHFYHSSLLIGELIKACKPYQLLVREKANLSNSYL